jgi:uncharacterized protein YbjT (DUF2867 family)
VYLVTGATGNVGSAVVRALAERGEHVRAVSRHPRPSDLPGVEAVAGDLIDPASLAGPLDGATGVFLLAGYDGLPALLQRAQAAGVARVVLLSSSSVSTGETDNAVVAYHARAEEDVRASGLPWTFLRPSMFMTNALEWADQIAAGDAVRVRFPQVRAAVIDPEDVGAVAAEAVVGGAQEGRALRLTGPESLLPADRVAVLGRTLGRELRFVGMSDEESRAEVFATMPEHYARAFVRFYLDGELDESPVLPTVRDVLGREPRTFARWAADHATAFGARTRQ